MKIAMHRLSLSQIPVDLFADPDGTWTYESLVTAAGFDIREWPPPVVAALAEPWGDHPAGAAVVAGADACASVVAIIECDAAADRAA